MNRRKFFALAPAAVLAPVAAHSASTEAANVIFEVNGEELTRMAIDAGRTVAAELLDDIARGDITINEARAHLHALRA